MKTKISRSKLCCLIAALLVVLSIFWMFGHAAYWAEKTALSSPSLFQLAFGIGLDRRPGFTAIFAIEILANIASVLVYLCYKNVIIGETGMGIFAIISSCFSLILATLAFCSLPLIGNSPLHVIADGYLGFGSILFAVFHLASIGLNVYALILDRKENQF